MVGCELKENCELVEIVLRVELCGWGYSIIFDFYFLETIALTNIS